MNHEWHARFREIEHERNVLKAQMVDILAQRDALLAACGAVITHCAEPLDGCDCGECEAMRQVAAAIAVAKEAQ